MIKCIVNIEYFLIFWEGGWYFWPLKGFGNERFHQPVTACYNPYHVTPPTTPQPIKTCYQIPVLFLYMCIKQWLIKLLQLFQLYTDKSYLYLKHERAHLITSLPVLFMCLIAVPYNMTLVKYYLLFDPGMFPFTSLICLPAKTLNKALPRKENPVPPEFLNQNYVYLLNWNRISYTSV